MKIHSFVLKIVIFSLIFYFFILPGLFLINNNTTNYAFSNWSFNPERFIFFIFSIVFYLFTKKYLFDDRINESNLFFDDIKRKSLFDRIISSSLAFCLILTTSLILKYTSLNTEAHINQFKTSEFIITIPSGIREWFFCLLLFTGASFFEEIIYRFYLPDAIINFFPEEKQTLLVKIFSEAFTLICFALGHLYLGIYSVINAAIAHVIFRILYKRTDSIFCSFIVHLTFNVLSLVLFYR